MSLIFHTLINLNFRRLNLMINTCPNEKPKVIEPYTDNEILEIIKVLGFQEPHNLLWQKGFTDLRKNLKLLRAYSGDVNLI